MSAPEISQCRFCGESFKPAGIKNHERWCDDHPEKGMDPDRAAELGLLEDEDPAGEEPSVADPHQRDGADGGSLPSRTELPSASKVSDTVPADEDDDECPSCGSSNVITTGEALEGFRDRLEDVPAGLIQTLESTEIYCNECFSVSGGALPEPFDLTEAIA